VDAVDLSPAAIAWARECAAQAGLGAAEVRFHRGDAFELTREELLGPYDLVYDSGCFHHLPPHTPESRRATPIATAAADMRSLPFAAERFDVVLSADNSVAHLLTDEDLRNALRSLRYALRPDGLLVITLRDYEEARASHPCSTAPQVTLTPTGRVITFQRWHWQPDGERYELEHFQVFQLLPDGDTRVAETTSVRGRHATCRALTRGQLRAFAEAAGFADVRWLEPAESGFFQPVLTARAAAPAA
jgi:glycine/sarcosine N-methyltransferase